MNELVPDADRANDVRRLNMLWYGMLPGGIAIVMAALYAWMQTGAYTVPAVDQPLARILPMIFAVAVLFGAGLTLFLKSRLPDIVARNPAGKPFQRVSAAAFTLLGAADAAAFIGIGVYLVNPEDWLVLAIIFYAVAAAVLFKPDFEGLLAIEKA